MKLIAFSFTLLVVCALCAHGATTYPAISSDTEYEHIARVQFGSIDNSSGAAGDGYGDYTAQSTTMPAGSLATITLTPRFAGGSHNEGWSARIDLNHDGDFTDSGKQVYTSPSASSSAVSRTITIPAGTAPTTTRMRVVMKYDPVPSSSSGSIGDGEAEDYTILISVGDTTPPAAPTGISATAGDGSVSLNGGDNDDPDLDSYTAYRSTTSGSGYSSRATDLSNSDYVDNNVTNGTTYYYVVTATDISNNEPGYSAEAQATLQSQGGNLVVHWALDDAYYSGDDLMTADNSGHGNNGTLLNVPDGGAMFRPGLDGNCLELVGTDDSVRRINVSSLTLEDSSAWSMNLYVKVDRQPKDWTRIANLGEARQRQLFIYKDGEVAFLYKAEGLMLTGKKLIPGNWHMLTVCYDPPLSQLRVYFNGTEAATETLPFDASDILDPKSNLLAYAHSGNFEGCIDEFTVWGEALDASEIQELADLLPLLGDGDGSQNIDMKDVELLAQEWLSNNRQIVPELILDDLEDYIPAGSDPNFAQRWYGSIASINTVSLLSDPAQAYQGSQAAEWSYDFDFVDQVGLYVLFDPAQAIDLRNYDQLRLWVRKHSGSTDGRLFCKFLTLKAQELTFWDMGEADYPGGLDALPDDTWSEWVIDISSLASWDAATSEIPADRINDLAGLYIGSYSEGIGNGTVGFDRISLWFEGQYCDGLLRPFADLDTDCDVDWFDFCYLAEVWLD